MKNEIISMVEKTKEKNTEKVHFIFRAIFVTKRIKRVVQASGRQKVRKRNDKNEALWNFIAIKSMIETFGEVFLDESDIPMIDVVIEALRSDTYGYIN